MSNHERVSRRRAKFDDEQITSDLFDDTPDHSRPPASATQFDGSADEFHDVDEFDDLSTYRDAVHGPDPVPAWVITDANARDEDLGVLKTGKEADCSLVRRTLASTGESCLLAAKRFRDGQHRMFHRDAGYLEGRRMRRSRETRAIATRTAFGKDLISGQWAHAEFEFLGRLWSAGASVPYPVQLIGTEIMMEFIGTPAGVAAPRLAQVSATRAELVELYHQCRTALGIIADIGYTHGDLSPYNILVDDGRIVLIDVPQVVDLVGNPQGRQFLERDCSNLCSWFANKGVDEADTADLVDELWSYVPA